MSKLDELRRAAGGNAVESMAARVAPPMHRASPPAAAAPDRLRGVARSKTAAEIPVDRIGPDPDQPREEFEAEALDRLAESLKARGQLQPIRVRWDEGRGMYVVICGERRWRAAQLAGMTTMTCIVAEGEVDAAELLTLQLVENLLREDLQPIEQARAFRALMDRNGWSARQVARELAVTQSSVVRALALLDLPDAVQEQVEQGALPPATAYEVSKLGDPAAQAEVAARVLAEGLSRSETIEAVRRAAERPGRGGRARGKGPRRAAAKVIRLAGAKVTVELRKAAGEEAILEALEAAATHVRSLVRSPRVSDESTAA